MGVLALPPYPTSCSSQHVFLKEQEPAGTLGASMVSACKSICPCAPGPAPCACLQPFLHSGSIMAESVCALCKVSGTFLWCSVEIPPAPHLSSNSLRLCFSTLLLGFLSWSQISWVPITLQGPAAIFQLYTRQAQTWPFCSKADTQTATEKECTPNLAQPLGGTVTPTSSFSVVRMHPAVPSGHGILCRTAEVGHSHLQYLEGHRQGLQHYLPL